MLCPEQIAMIASAIAVSFSENKSTAELSMYAAIFTQVGDTLATIATGRSNIEDCLNEKTSDSPFKPIS